MKKRYLPVLIATGLSLLALPFVASAHVGTMSEKTQVTSTNKVIQIDHSGLTSGGINVRGTSDTRKSILGLGSAGIQSLVQNTSGTTQKVYSGSANVVMTENDAYNPDVLYVTPGTTVTWKTVEGPEPHSVISDTGLFKSAHLYLNGKTFSYTFKNPGIYKYHCGVHAGMAGTIIVTDQNQTTTNSSSSKNASSNPITSTNTNTNITSTGNSNSYPIAPLGSGTAGEIKQADGTYLLPYKMENGYKVFHLDAKPVWWQVKPGKVVEAWAYNGSVPGPEIKVNQGDKVKIVVKNDLPEGTTVHWHGINPPFAQDGTNISQPDIAPGKSWTYTFTVKDTPGTYIYHSHPMKDMLKQEQMGLWGPIIVEPKGTGWQQIHPGYQDEYTMIVNDSPQFGFTINGKVFPATAVMPVTVGDNVLVHLINMGSSVHSMHLHQVRFTEIEQDGAPIPAPISMKTLTISPGQTFDFTFNADHVGTYLYHCHMINHVVDQNGNMTGMVTMFHVTPKNPKTVSSVTDLPDNAVYLNETAYNEPAYDLKYVSSNSDAKTALNNMLDNAPSEVFIKKDGKFTNFKGEPVANPNLSEVTYTGKDGQVTYYNIQPSTNNSKTK